MPRPRTKEYGASKTILKHFEHLAYADIIPESMGTTVGDRKIVKAGTPFPSNDAQCKGLVLENIDVTYGDSAGSIVYEGSIDNAKLTEAGITVDPTAKAVLPRLTFFD